MSIGGTEQSWILHPCRHKLSYTECHACWPAHAEMIYQVSVWRGTRAKARRDAAKGNDGRQDHAVTVRPVLSRQQHLAVSAANLHQCAAGGDIPGGAVAVRVEEG